MKSNAQLGYLGLAAGILLGSTGCATRGYVRDRVAELQTTMGSEDARLRAEAERIDQDARSAQQSADSARAGLGPVRDLALGRVDYREASRSRVYFALGSSQLTDESKSALDGAADLVRRYPQYVVDIYGFADASGPAELNFNIARRRAEAVERYLVERTGSLQRYRSLSFGELIPATEVAEMNRPEQRRQVLVVLLERTPPNEKYEELAAR